MGHASTIPIVTCSACGYSNLPGEMFCQNCGVQLPPVASSPPPAPTPMVNTAAPGNSGQTAEKSQGSSNRLAANVAWGSELASGVVHFSGKLILRNSDVELLLPPNQQEVVIGRTDPVQNIYPDVDLAEQDGEKNGVSRRHARILQRADGVYIEDLNSTNFTFLNHIRLVPGQVYPLKDGDELRLGVLTLDYRS